MKIKQERYPIFALPKKNLSQWDKGYSTLQEIMSVIFGSHIGHNLLENICSVDGRE